MSTDTKKRGIVDPWKVVAPLKDPPPPKAPAKGEKVDLATVDMDADIRPSRSCVFRGKHASVEVSSKNVHTENDALGALVMCLLDVADLDSTKPTFVEYHIGVRQGGREYNAPAVDENGAAKEPVSTMGALDATIYFRNQNLDQGLLRLVRLLRAVQRRPEGEKILKHWGVTPMLR